MSRTGAVSKLKLEGVDVPSLLEKFASTNKIKNYKMEAENKEVYPYPD